MPDASGDEVSNAHHRIERLLGLPLLVGAELVPVAPTERSDEADRDDPFGVDALVTGHPAAAVERCLVTAASGEGGGVAAVAAAWGSAASDLRASTAPGDVVVTSVDLTARGPELWRRPSGPATSGEPPLEVALLGRLLPTLRLARTQLGPSLATVDRAAAATLALDTIASCEDAAAAVGADPVVAYCRRLRVDVLQRAHRAGSEVDAAIAAAFDAAGDRPGAVAATHLSIGDRRLAPSTHPDAADLTVLDGGTETSALPWSIEGAEADQDRGDPASATAAYDAAEAALGGAGHPALLLRRAALARLAGEPADAVRIAERALAAATRAGDAWTQATARAHLVLARIAAGATAGDDDPTTIGRWGATTGSASFALGLGLVLSRAGRWWLTRHGDADRALACHRAARLLHDELGALTLSSVAIADEGQTFTLLGANAAALSRYDEALRAHLGRLTDPARAADAWRRAGGLALRVHTLRLGDDDPRRLRAAAEQLAAVADATPPGTDQTGDRLLRTAAREAAAAAAVHATLAEGDAVRDRGDDTAAAASYEQALTAATAADDGLARAVTLGRLGRTADAVAAYRAHEAQHAAREAAQLDALRSSNDDPAVAAAIAAFDRAGHARRRAAAFLVRTGAWEEAGAEFDALDATDPDWWRTDDRPWELLSDHGHAREVLGDLDRAASLHAEAVAALTSRTARVARDDLRTSLLAGGGRVIARSARTALRRAAADGDPLGPDAVDSFALGEAGRSRGLAHLLASTRSVRRHGDGPDVDVIGRWLAASARVSLLEQQLVDADTEVHRDELRSRLRDATTELAEADASRRAELPGLEATDEETTVASVATRLGDDEALIAWLAVDDDLLTWAISSDGLVVADRREVGRRRLDRTLQELSAACAGGGAWSGAGHAAAALLLPPVDDVVARFDRLLLVPTAVGHSVPLVALPWRDALLVDHATVAVLPSAATLQYLPPSTTVAGPSLVVGDPADPAVVALDGTRTVAAPLPAARIEAQAVAATMPDARLHVGRDATAAAVDADVGDARYVHLAAHAVVDPQAPLATAVLLADGDALRVVDLVGRSLTADLVVLSACESGRGSTPGGEEVVGFTRALLAAGAAAAIVSLWPVDDRATAILMTRCTDELTAGVPAPDALTNAQRWYRGLDEAGAADAWRALLTRVGADVGPAVSGALGERIVRSLVRTAPAAVAPAHPRDWAAFVYVGPHPGDRASS